MRYSLSFILSSAVGLVGSLYAVVPAARLVDEQTPFAILIEDLPAVRQQWIGSPWERTWNDAQTKAFLAPLRARMKIDQWDETLRAESGYTMDELVGMATGQMLFAISGDLVDAVVRDEPRPPAFLFAIEVTGNEEKVAAVLSNATAKDPEQQDEVEDYDGVTLHVSVARHDEENPDDDTQTYWALTAGYCLLSLDRDTIQTAIDAARGNGVDAPLEQNPRFQEARERSGEGAGVFFFANIEGFYRSALAVAKAREAAAAQPVNPMGFSAEAVLQGLGLDTWREVYLNVRLGAAETRLHGGLTYSERRGLTEVLAYTDEPSPRPDWVPSSWLTVASGSLSLSKGFAALETMLDAINPMMAGMVQGQLRAFDRKAGIDLKRDLIGTTGTEIVTAYAAPPGFPAGRIPSSTEIDQFFSVSLKDSATFLRALEALKSLLGPAADKMLPSRDYLGTPIVTFTPAVRPDENAPARRIHYAVTHDHVFIGVGSPATIEAALRGLAGGQPSFWARTEVEAALQQVPAGAVGLGYQDTGVVLASVVEMLAMIPPTNTGGADEPMEDEAEEAAGTENVTPSLRVVDLTARPDVAKLALYWGPTVQYTTLTSEGMFTDITLQHPQP